MLKIALPNKGSLSEGAVQLIKNAGYKVRRSGKQLFCTDEANGVEFYFLRPKDITAYVASGTFTLGITGRDIVQDTHFDNINEALPLGFGKSKMRYIIPGADEFTGLDMFEGKTIACSYPILIKKHLASQNVNADVVKLDGAVEISIQLGIADAAADVVETGTTIREAGLKTVGETVLESEAILISADAALASNALAQTFIKRLNGIIVARKYVMLEYDIPTTKMEQACELVPGFESPTIAALHDPEWKGVKVMIPSSEINASMDKLEALGAKGIIATDIRTCRL